MVECIMPKMQTLNQRQEPFHQLIDKASEWIAFVKFYFYDSKSGNFLKTVEGTGFLNSKWTMITACQNLYLPPKNIKCSHCEIYLLDSSRNNKQIIIKSRPALQWFQSAEHGLALIRLDQQVKHFKGGVFFGDNADFKAIQISKCQQLYVTGFPTKFKNESSSSSRTQMHRMRSAFQKFTQNGVQYKGEMQNGLSGSPVIYQSQDKCQPQLKIIGMHLSKNPLLNESKGLLFNKIVINLIYYWMNQYFLDRVKIQNRFSMMMAYCMKIFQSFKRQLLPKEQYPGQYSNKCMIKRQQQYEVLAHDRQDPPNIKDYQRQQVIGKEYQKLNNLIVNDQRQQKVKQTIGDIYALENQPKISEMFYSNSRDIIELTQNQNNSSHFKESVTKLKEKKKKKTNFPNNNNHKKVEQLHLKTKTTQQEQNNGLQCIVIENQRLSQYQCKKIEICNDKCQSRKQFYQKANEPFNEDKKGIHIQNLKSESEKQKQNPKNPSEKNTSFNQSSFNANSVESQQQLNKSSFVQKQKIEQNVNKPFNKDKKEHDQSEKYIQSPNLSSENNQSLNQSSFNANSVESSQQIIKLFSQKSDSSSRQQKPSLMLGQEKNNMKDQSSFIDEGKISIYKLHSLEINNSNLFTFPNNCNGWITCIDKQGNYITFANGCLIAPKLVLTTASIFLIYKDNKLRQVFPSYFTVIGERNKVNKIKIINYRMSRQYLDYEEMIADYYQQKKSSGDDKWDKQILKIKEWQLKYDFALLQLEEIVVRTQYFDLVVNSPNFDQDELTICGFTHNNKNRFLQISQKTHIQIPIKPQDEFIHQNIDEMLGQRGSPVYIKNNESANLVAIHVSYSAQCNSNIGLLLTDKIISVIQHWATQMQSTLLIHPQAKKDQLKKQLELLNHKYKATLAQIHLMVENQKLQQALQFLRYSYLNIFSQKKEPNQQFKRNKIEKYKLFKDRQHQNVPIQQMQRKLQSLQLPMPVANINEADSSQQLLYSTGKRIQKQQL